MVILYHACFCASQRAPAQLTLPDGGDHVAGAAAAAGAEFRHSPTRCPNMPHLLHVLPAGLGAPPLGWSVLPLPLGWSLPLLLPFESLPPFPLLFPLPLPLPLPLPFFGLSPGVTPPCLCSAGAVFHLPLG